MKKLLLLLSLLISVSVSAQDEEDDMISHGNMKINAPNLRMELKDHSTLKVTVTPFSYFKDFADVPIKIILKDSTVIMLDFKETVAPMNKQCVSAIFKLTKRNAKILSKTPMESIKITIEDMEYTYQILLQPNFFIHALK